MPDKGKAFLCQILSSLFCPPDLEMVEPLSRGHLYHFFKNLALSWGGEKGAVEGFLTQRPPQILVRELQEEYDRLFSETGKERIPLVESCYKPWTRDPHCSLPFAKEAGFLMGDSALHLLALFRELGLEVAAPFQGMPDHISIELEFLGYLYERTGEEVTGRVIEDHFDWIPLLKERCQQAKAHPFYLTLIEVLDLFIEQEKRRLEKSGEKEIYRTAG